MINIWTVHSIPYLRIIHDYLLIPAPKKSTLGTATINHIRINQLVMCVSIVGHPGLLNSATVASSPVCCCISAHCSAGEAQVWASWMECSV